MNVILNILRRLRRRRVRNDDLEHILRSAGAPERPADYWEAFPGRVMGQLRVRLDNNDLRSPRGTDSRD